MGRRYLSLVPMAIFSMALQAQPAVAGGTARTAQPMTPIDAAQAAQANSARAGQPMAAAAVSAELTKRIDTKNAKQGDEVDARVTETAKLPDGTELPRGTKLLGKVTDVKAKSKEDKSAHLSFNIDHAVLKDGKQLPVVVIVTSVTGPSQGSAQGMMPGGGASPSTAGGSSGSSGSMGSSTPSTPSAPVMSDTGQSNAGGVLKSAQDRVPVGNMPGVTLSGPGNTTGSAGSLDASGENISLDSGTKLTLTVAPGGAPVGQ
jgi:hypothetical protein